MAKNNQLTPDEAAELFSELDASGVVASDRSGSSRGRSGRAKSVDPLSGDDPSGSHVGEAISRTAIACIVVVLVLVVGMQVAYGVIRRLNTANLSDRVDIETVSHAMESGVEWGNGFTQFPEDYIVEEADERTGVLEVSVTDVSSGNELELLSNSQIQAAALATNALLNEKIDRVVYNVFVLLGDDGGFAHDRFFGFVKAKGTRRAMLTFVWTKDDSSVSNYIDWELRIIGMDDDTTAKIQEQVNSVSSLADRGGIKQGEMEDARDEQRREQLLHGTEIFHGGPAEKDPKDYVPKKK